MQRVYGNQIAGKYSLLWKQHDEQKSKSSNVLGHTFESQVGDFMP